MSVCRLARLQAAAAGLPSECRARPPKGPGTVARAAVLAVVDHPFSVRRVWRDYDSLLAVPCAAADRFATWKQLRSED